MGYINGEDETLGSQPSPKRSLQQHSIPTDFTMCDSAPIFTPILPRCFLHDCPCDSTSPHDAIVINVETSTAVRARDSAVEAVVYRCAWNNEHSQGCGMFIGGTHREILSHLRQRHGVGYSAKENLQCRWRSCSTAGLLKIGSIPRHVAKHLGIQSKCSGCEQVMTREDVVQDHIKKSPGCAGAVVEMIPGPEARQIVSPHL
ncbi:hypothetical protein DFH29DRAFT_120555 [Suillus ampliporus]|nr:hypothetical protein DFH29DRAFT_120555 [Suillus ampliporus]